MGSRSCPHTCEGFWVWWLTLISTIFPLYSGGQFYILQSIKAMAGDMIIYLIALSKHTDQTT
jgi:uncharacterized membrane protein YhaH (DUF805 family)